jgi:hypothetical protein
MLLGDHQLNFFLAHFMHRFDKIILCIFFSSFFSAALEHIPYYSMTSLQLLFSVLRSIGAVDHPSEVQSALDTYEKNSELARMARMAHVPLDARTHRGMRMRKDQSCPLVHPSSEPCMPYTSGPPPVH